MTGNELRAMFEADRTMAVVGTKVRARWSAGSFGHFAANATVVKVNEKSVRVKLDEEIRAEKYNRDTGEFYKAEVLYPLGHLVTVARFTVETLSDGRWSDLCGAELQTSAKVA